MLSSESTSPFVTKRLLLNKKKSNTIHDERQITTILRCCLRIQTPVVLFRLSCASLTSEIIVSTWMLELPLGPTLPPINPPCRDRNEEEGVICWWGVLQPTKQYYGTLLLLQPTVAVSCNSLLLLAAGRAHKGSKNGLNHRSIGYPPIYSLIKKYK